MDRLAPLQREFLKSWFGETQEYFLTGGAALIGFYNVPRYTDDVDLFTVDPLSFATVASVMNRVCGSIGAESEVLRASPNFRRYRVVRGSASVIVDVVLDEAPQLHSVKSQLPSGEVVDPLDEIMVNKVCAIVGRSEPRDYFDVWFLSSQGQDRTEALRLAAKKDGGVTSESMLFVLQSVSWRDFRIPDADAESTESVIAFFRGWCDELALGLFPDAPGPKMTQA